MSRAKVRFYAALKFNVVKKVVIQGAANVNELLHIDTASLKNEINIGTSAIDSPRKFGHAQTALVENGFDELPYMNILLRGHIAYHFPMTIKKRGSYNLLTPRFSTTHTFNKFSTPSSNGVMETYS